MICSERLLQHFFVFLLLNRKHSLSQQWIMLLLIYAEVQFDLKCSVNLISLILRLFSFLLLFKCEQTFQIVALCNECLPNLEHVCVPTWLDKGRSISTLLARFCRYGLLRSPSPMRWNFWPSRASIISWCFHIEWKFLLNAFETKGQAFEEKHHRCFEMPSIIGFHHPTQGNFDVPATRKSPPGIQHCFRRKEKEKIFSAIRLKYNWHKRFLPNARNVKSCPAVTRGVIIVELSLFRMANEKEKKKR